MSDRDTYTIGRLHRRSRNAVAREFRGPVWVKGEIRNLREHRGSLYLQLVDPGEFADGGDVTLDVACWPKRRLALQAELARLGIVLAAGIEVHCSGTLTFSKTGRLQLELANLDTQAILGRQAGERKLLIEALLREGLFDANRALLEPFVPLRIGLVTSEGSEGFRDFMGQLTNSDIAFTVTLAHSPVQGPTAPALLARAIASFDANRIDVIAVVRGGGGELDAFDKEPVVRAIVASAIPIWTGVGHTGDRSVADEVAQRSFITPTACGQGILATVEGLIKRTNRALGDLHRLAVRMLSQSQHEIETFGRSADAIAGHCLDRQMASVMASARHVRQSTLRILERTDVDLHRPAERTRRCAERTLDLAGAAQAGYQKDALRAIAVVPQDAADELQRIARSLTMAGALHQERLTHEVELWRSQIRALDPVRQLQRGYSLTHKPDGTLVRSVTEVSDGETVITTLSDGHLSSQVCKTQAQERREAL